MIHHLIVVEGAHDAAFFGKLLRRRGFSEVALLSELVEPWHGLVPRKFPIRDDGRLDKIVVYPNVYCTDDKQTWTGIAIAGGGEDKVIESLRAPIELNDVQTFSSIGIAIDADWKLEVPERFKRFMQVLEAWNQEEAKDGLEGFPIELPDTPNKIVGSSLKFGVFLFPESKSQGTLETLVLECAALAMPALTAHAEQYLKAVLDSEEIDPLCKKDIASASGKQKSQCGSIGNVFAPGSSLAVALRGNRWLNDASLNLPNVQTVDTFLGELLGS